MAKTGRKSEDMRHVSFRMAADVHQDYIEIAQSRGVDLSAVLNWVLIEYWPVLLLRRAEHGAAMLRAIGANLPHPSVAGPDLQQTLAKVNDVIRQLQDVASKLWAHLGGGDRRQTAGDGSRVSLRWRTRGGRGGKQLPRRPPRVYT